MNSVFDPQKQIKEIDSKIIVGLERISEAFKVMLGNEGRKFGLSPVQQQIITFILFHPDETIRSVSQISAEFNTTKASISDSIKSLENKGLIYRIKNQTDFRVSSLNLTEKGKLIALEVSSFTKPMEEIIEEMPNESKVLFLDSVMQILHKLLKKGIISIQRMCLNCSFYIKNEDSKSFKCDLFDYTFKKSDLRLDCHNYKVNSKEV